MFDAVVVFMSLVVLLNLMYIFNLQLYTHIIISYTTPGLCSTRLWSSCRSSCSAPSTSPSASSAPSASSVSSAASSAPPYHIQLLHWHYDIMSCAAVRPRPSAPLSEKAGMQSRRMSCRIGNRRMPCRETTGFEQEFHERSSKPIPTPQDRFRMSSRSRTRLVFRCRLYRSLCLAHQQGPCSSFYHFHTAESGRFRALHNLSASYRMTSHTIYGITGT